MTIVTTKWRPSAGNGQAGYSASSASEMREARQAEFATELSSLISAGATLDASKEQGDEWRIVYDLVERIDASNSIIRAESDTVQTPQPPPPEKRSRCAHYFGWMNCEYLRPLILRRFLSPDGCASRLCLVSGQQRLLKCAGSTASFQLLCHSSLSVLADAFILLPMHYRPCAFAGIGAMFHADESRRSAVGSL